MKHERKSALETTVGDLRDALSGIARSVQSPVPSDEERVISRGWFIEWSEAAGKWFFWRIGSEPQAEWAHSVEYAKRCIDEIEDDEDAILDEGEPREAWNKCDVCGRFIPLADFESGAATRRLLTPDSHLTRETYETLCLEHAEGEDFEGEPREIPLTEAQKRTEYWAEKTDADEAWREEDDRD